MQYGASDTLCAGISSLSASLSSLPMKNLPPSRRAMRGGHVAAGAADALAAGVIFEAALAAGIAAPLWAGPGDGPRPRPSTNSPPAATTARAASPSTMTPRFDDGGPPVWFVAPLCGSGTEMVAAAATSEDPPGALRAGADGTPPGASSVAPCARGSGCDT